MKRMIIGMSKSRSDLAAWIDDHTYQVMVAIAQLYAFPYGNRVHWRKEVWEKFSEMHLFKHNSKLPDAKFIYDNSWGVNKEFVSDALGKAIDKEEDYSPKDDLDTSELYNIMENYFKWLSTKLSQSKSIRRLEVAEKLDELGLKEQV